MNEIEIWKPIPLTNGHYDASSMGRIRRAIPGVGTYAGRILKPGKSKTKKNAYYNITIVVNGKSISRGVHTLICEAFNGPRPPGFIVGHKNDDPTDNRPDNLEWTTQSQNMKQAFERGRKISPSLIPGVLERSIATRKKRLQENPERRPTGEKNSFAKYSNAFVAEVRQFRLDHPEMTLRQIAKHFSINHYTCRGWMFNFHRKNG